MKQIPSMISMQHKVATNKHKFLFSSRLATGYLCVTIKIHNVLHQLTQGHEASLKAAHVLCCFFFWKATFHTPQMLLSAVVFNPNALASSGFRATHVFSFSPTPSERNLLNSRCIFILSCAGTRPLQEVLCLPSFRSVCHAEKRGPSSPRA